MAEPPSEDLSITFDESDTAGLDRPHNDPLVSELMIGNCEVTRILVDTGSIMDMIYKETLKKMEVKDDDIK